MLLVTVKFHFDVMMMETRSFSTFRILTGWKLGEQDSASSTYIHTSKYGNFHSVKDCIFLQEYLTAYGGNLLDGWKNCIRDHDTSSAGYF